MLKIRPNQTYDAEMFISGHSENISEFVSDEYTVTHHDSGHSSEVIYICDDDLIVCKMYPGDVLMKRMENDSYILEVIPHKELKKYDLITQGVPPTPEDIALISPRFLEIQ
jgi:hypothetical protein